MSTFYAKSASEVELFPWVSIWFDSNAFATSSMIIRWIQMGSVYFTKVDLKALKSGRTEHHQLRMSQLDSTEQVGCQGGFEILDDGKNRASSVANFLTAS